MTQPTARDKVNNYAAQTNFDRGDLGDDREHMAPAAFVALRYVLAACDELDRHDLMAAAAYRIRAAIATAFDHVATTATICDRRGNHITGTVHGTVVQAGNIDGGLSL